MKNMAVLYGVPKVAYGMEGCTPFPMCVKACAEYLGIPADYTQVMAESGAAFRLTWNTTCWDGGNVDPVFAFDSPNRLFSNGLRSMVRSFKILERTSETKKEDFMEFIRGEIDGGNPVIALGIIGPPEACIIAGYRDGGNTLLGWNFFQEYPENQAQVRFEENGYFVTEAWWENPDTCALVATGTETVPPFSPRETLQNAAEVLTGRKYDNFAKGVQAYDAWRNALLCDSNFPEEAILPVLVEHMMCHGDAMDCLSDGRNHAAKYFRNLAEKYPAHAEKLNATAHEFEGICSILWNEMVPVLGGWERGEEQIRRLAEQKNRKLFAGMIERMKAHDVQALEYIRQLVDII